jgi:hypothetical protein
VLQCWRDNYCLNSLLLRAGEPGDDRGVQFFMENPIDTDEFELIACHPNRAGHASVVVRHHSTGATVTIQDVPFAHIYGENDRQACRRIAVEAAAIATGALAYLVSLPSKFDILNEPRPGAAPNDAAPSDAIPEGGLEPVQS